MAEVYLAQAQGEAGFTKPVALKRILESYAGNPQIAKMFMDEARLVARLSHPNLVQVFDFGHDEQGYFIAMEYVPGPDLAAVLRVLRQANERPPEAPMIDVVIQVLRGLDQAHRLCGPDGAPLHLVHRDLSPSNVLLTGDGVAKLSDFGVARATERLGDNTRAGKTRGKAAYMAPEQARSKPVDARTDVFAAGLLLWEVLTGVACYQAEGEAALIQLAGKGEVRPLASVGFEAPAPLQQILDTALQREPAQRYPSAAAMAEALEAYHREAFPKYTASALGGLVQRVLASLPPLAHLQAPPAEPSTAPEQPAEPPSVKMRRPRAVLAETRPSAELRVEQQPAVEPTAQEIHAPARKSRFGAVALSVLAIAIGVAAGLAYMDRTRASEHPALTTLPPATPLVAADAGARGKAPRSAAPAHLASASEQGTGYLTVKCDPWCEIRIDGRASGRRSPAARIPLAAGRHTLQLVNPTVNLSRRATVEIQPGEELSRYFNLVLGH